jgi:hypothetical protein
MTIILNHQGVTNRDKRRRIDGRFVRCQWCVLLVTSWWMDTQDHDGPINVQVKQHEVALNDALSFGLQDLVVGT